MEEGRQVDVLQMCRELWLPEMQHDIFYKGCIDLGEAIADQIHDTLQFPGQIKVTVGRESRSKAIAT